jgi:hypothetical protein
MNTKIVMDREAVDRMILVGMDADRYQTQVIPDLQRRVGELMRALKAIIDAVEAARQKPSLGDHLEAASLRASQVLHAVLPQTKGGQL